MIKYYLLLWGEKKIEETFKDIEYQGLKITVSNLGTVVWDGCVRNRYYNADGYAMCSLKIPNKGWRSIFVHILVATAFVPNPNNLPEVNHKDYNRANPKSNNLEWVTRIDNIRYSLCNMPDYHGANNPNYGNKSLSVKYKNDRELAKQKQSRPGLQNGRCVPIELYCDGVFVNSFDYILSCGQYLIDIGVAQTNKASSVVGKINLSIKNNRPYKGHYTFIKKNFNLQKSNDYRKDIILPPKVK